MTALDGRACRQVQAVNSPRSEWPLAGGESSASPRNVFAPDGVIGDLADPTHFFWCVGLSLYGTDEPAMKPPRAVLPCSSSSSGLNATRLSWPLGLFAPYDADVVLAIPWTTSACHLRRSSVIILNQTWTFGQYIDGEQSFRLHNSATSPTKDMPICDHIRRGMTRRQTRL